MIEPITTGLLVGSSLLGAGSSLLGANKASKAAGSAADQQRQLAQQDLAFRQQLFDYERQMTGPAREKLRDMAMSDRPLFYDQTANAIRQNYTKTLRGMGGLGYTSGLRSALTQGANLNQASDLGGAYSQGMMNRLGLLQGVAGSDRSLQAGMNYSQGLGNLGQFYGQQAGMYNQAAAQGWQNFGQNLSGLAYGLAAMGSAPQQAAPQIPAQTMGQTGVPAQYMGQTAGFTSGIPAYSTGINIGTYGQPLSYGINPSTSSYGWR